MEFRQAIPADLPQLEATYRAIVAQMAGEETPIWDEDYPLCAFPQDIAQGRLYTLWDGGVLVAAFSLEDSHEWADEVVWPAQAERACYMSRLGVHPAYRRRGVAALMLEKAEALTWQRGGQCLRLFVVDGNQAALRLYTSRGFVPAEGAYCLPWGGGTLRQVGYQGRELRKMTP